MEKTFSVAIIGGGASGLLCAVELLRGKNAINGKDIVILERTDRVGKKLIATGNGQGNLSNAKFDKEYYHGNKEFIEQFIKTAREIDIERYFSQLGIPFYTDEKGRKYPLSRQASAVLDIFREILSQNGVNVITDFYASDVKKTKNGFEVQSLTQKILAKKVVVACGGSAGKQFGTDGTSYHLLEKFGHKCTPLYPSLVQVKTELEKIRGLKGLKEYARVYALDGEKELKSQTGDILFTEYGVSGNTVFTVSGYLATAKNPVIRIEFLPDFTLEETEKLLEERSKSINLESLNVLCGIVNKKIGERLVKNINSTKPKDMAKLLKDFRLKVSGNLGFNYAQVTKGGIKTDQIDEKTYQSKLVDGLYLTGEVLDVDGDCGGYNLTFAFCSGILSAKSIKDSLE